MSVPFEFVGIKGNWFAYGPTYTLDLPAGLQVGDLLLAVGSGAGRDFLTDPPGWNVARSWAGAYTTWPSGDFVPNLDGLYWKLATQADIDWPWIEFIGAIFAYRGVDRVLEAGWTVTQSGICVQYEAAATVFSNTGEVTSLPLSTMDVPTLYTKDGVGFASTYGRSYYVEGWLFGCCHNPHSSGPVTPSMAIGGVQVGAARTMWASAAAFILASGPGPGKGPRGLTMFM